MERGINICGAIYDRPDTLGELELERGSTLPNPVRCTLPDKHPGSHSYTDGFGGVSWDNDPETDAAMRDGMRELARQRADFPSVIAYGKQLVRERRERIAENVMASLMSRSGFFNQSDYGAAACIAINAADALIDELDKGESRALLYECFMQGDNPHLSFMPDRFNGPVRVKIYSVTGE